MADIFHDFPINAPISKVFAAVSTPSGLDQWWTKQSKGTPGPGAEYELGFGPGYDWRALLTTYQAPGEIEFQMVESDSDWNGSRIGFSLRESGSGTQVKFHHIGWPDLNAHYRTSSFCWAMYLRVLKRHLEFAEVVPYEQRLEV